MATKVQCYSYIRWSSDAQAVGTSYERQVAHAKRVATENDLQYVERMVDRGVGAFNGKNSKQGALSKFINAVRCGDIPSNSWLVVENLDRITRQNPYQAFSLISELIDLGLTIVAGADSKKYNTETVNSDRGDLFSMILDFSRGHNESQLKQDRTFGHAKAIIEMHRSGVRSKEGYALAIESVGSNMWRTEKYKEDPASKLSYIRPHPIYYPIAQEIVSLTLDGLGHQKIINYLNGKYLPPKINKRSDEKYWSFNLIANFHKKKALYGLKEIRIAGVIESIPDYYTPIIDEDTFRRIQVLKSERKSRSAVKSPHIRLLSGLNILKCGFCGGGMHGIFINGKTLKYKCTNGRAKGCRPWSFNASYADETLLRLSANHIYRQENYDYEYGVDIQVYEIKLSEADIKIDKVVSAIESTDEDFEPLINRLSELQATKEECLVEIERLRIEQENQQQSTVVWEDISDSVLDINSAQVRTEVKSQIAKSVRSVICTQLGHGYIRFKIEFINGKSIVAERKLDVLAFDGVEWEKLGDGYGSWMKLDAGEADRIKEKYGLDYYSDEKLVVETDKELAEYCLDPREVSGVSGYEYRDITNLQSSMVRCVAQGPESELVLQDMKRLEHVAEWGRQYKFVPQIIEDQRVVYKHPDNDRVMLKAEAGLYYLADVDWRQYKNR